MQVPLLLKCFLLLILFSKSSHHAIGQGDSNGEEKAALDALKVIFNHPLLNSNWTGHPCTASGLSWHGIQCANGHVNGISLQSMGLTGALNKDSFKAFTELSYLSLENNSITGSLMNLSSNKKLKVVNLSGNRFHGRISQSLIFLFSLEKLQLQYNNLKFLIPAFNQTSLTSFNVSYNSLQGEIPRTRTLQSFHYDSFFNNPELCGPPTPNVCKSSTNDSAGNGTNDSSPPRKHSSKFPFATIFFLFDVVLLVAVILLFILYFRKAKELKKKLKKEEVEEKGKAEEEDNEYDDLEEKTAVSTEPTRSRSSAVNIAVEEKGKLVFMEDEGSFELNDLLKASAQGLGKGIFGNTYKATMEGRTSVVVKRLRDLKPLSVEEFTRQLSIIADKKHPNLLPLLAYYYSKDEKLLVCRYAAKGNIFNRIHGAKGKDRIPFRWSSRLSVARGVARALEYLHLSDKSQSIVPHGNLKSSNVLLDEHEAVLVSDYGLTSLVAQPIAAQHMVSYKSPEYLVAKRICSKSDVWSYGCLLLELLTGRVPAHSAPPGTNSVDLGNWVHRAVREEWTNEIFDVEISAQKSAAPGMLTLLQIAMRCCERYPDKRPEITEVLRDVENIKLAESEDEDDLSQDQSLTDDSVSTSHSGMQAEER